MPFLAGEILEADDLGGLSETWTAWTPTLTSSGGGAAVSNGTLTGRYRKVGKTVNLQFQLTFGSSTTFGSGFPVIGNLPYAYIGGVFRAGPALCQDVSTDFYSAIVWNGSGALVVSVAAGLINATRPMTWTTGDVLNGDITYETS